MTDERDTNGRERDELLRHVASAHAAALASKGGFKPQEIRFPQIEINWRKDEVRFQVGELDENGEIVMLYNVRKSARECRDQSGMGCFDIDGYLHAFYPLDHLPEGSFYRLQVRKPWGDWISIRWGRESDQAKK